MIIEAPTIAEESWQTILAKIITSPQELITILELDKINVSIDESAHHSFSLRVPRGYIAKIKKGDINDPLLRQILPIQDENWVAPGYLSDPLQENQSNPMAGLLHKYKNRVLITVTGKCAVNCRYCFRRHFPYSDNNPGSQGWKLILDYIQQDTSIHEVIYSGGDPLLANDKVLSRLTEQINDIPHVHTLRIHSRLPIVIPERISSTFINWFCNLRLHPVLVVHCNHPNELDKQIAHKMRLLYERGVTLLNQSVLLKGVNDDVTTLSQLSYALFKMKVLPYYLHLLDKVTGTAHFDLPTEQAKKIYQQLLESLPGYLVPKLVREEPGKGYKVPVCVTSS